MIKIIIGLSVALVVSILVIQYQVKKNGRLEADNVVQSATIKAMESQIKQDNAAIEALNKIYAEDTAKYEGKVNDLYNAIEQNLGWSNTDIPGAVIDSLRQDHTD